MAFLSTKRKEAAAICFKNHGFVTGGYAAHKAHVLQEYNDIDFYFPCETDLYLAAQEIVAKFGTGTLVLEEFGASFKDTISLNAVAFGTPDEVTHDFDVNIARWVIEGALDNKPVHHKGLCVNPSLEDSQASKTWQRLLKYMKNVWPSKRHQVVEATKEFLTLYGDVFDPHY
ncbi:MAG: hypothetical protein ACXABY_20325, partial [Candidatus Thorarchaeota archaeon]